MAALSKAWVTGLSPALIEGPETRLVHQSFTQVTVVSLRRADHLSRGVLQSVVCVSVIAKPRQ